VEKARATFRKQERLVSEKLIEELFGGGSSHALTAFPLRAVFLLKERQTGEEAVQVLISVPKKRFKHAVDRNRTKRQIREAWRQNKQKLIDTLPEEKRLLLAFVWLGDHLSATSIVESRVTNLLKRLSEQQ